MDYSTEFNLNPDIAYLNHAAVAPWPNRTVEAVKAFAEENGHQGSLAYPQWLKVEQALREKLRQLINADSTDEIALVKNTSEGLSFVAAGLDWEAGDNIVTSDQEFPSNRIVWESLAERGVELRQVDLSSADTPEDALAAAMDGRTRLLAISSVQYASGIRLDTHRLGEICRDRGCLYLLDAIQEVGTRPVDVQADQVDFLAADGHKWMLGPEGLGVFYCRRELLERLKLTQFGWHMVAAMGDYDRKEWEPAPTARRFEAGSPNMLAIHALDASLSLLLEVGLPTVSEAIEQRIAYLAERLAQTPGLEPVTPASPERRAGIYTVRLAHADPAAVQQQMSRQGVFCAPRGGGVRFSPHFYTPMETISRAVETLDGILKT